MTSDLRRIFEDPTLKRALEDFFDEQVAIFTTLSCEFSSLDEPQYDLARKHACYAKAYEEAMHRLEHHSKPV